jgi:hypothetical protein
MLVFNLSLNMSNVNLSVIEFQIQTRIKKMEIPSRIKKFADKVTANLLPVKSQVDMKQNTKNSSMSIDYSTLQSFTNRNLYKYLLFYNIGDIIVFQ